MDSETVYSTYKYARISPKKTAVVMDLVRGKTALEAERILKFNETKAAGMIYKVLKTAVANAESTKGFKKENLVVSDIRVENGPMYKRGIATARGRYSRRLKRTSHIKIGLSERK